MNDVDFLLERVKELVEEYSKDEKVQKEFCEKVEKLYFAEGQTEDQYDEEIASWRKKMPELTKDMVKLVDEGDFGYDDEVVIKVTNSDDERLNRLYSIVLISKLTRDLFYTPEILFMDPIEISDRDGSKGCIYFWFAE